MRKKRLWFRLLLIYVLVIVIPLLLLTGIVTFIINRQINQNTAQMVNNQLQIISINVDSLLKNARYSLSPLLIDSSLKTNLRNLLPYDQRQEDADHLAGQKIVSSLSTYSSYNSRVLSIDLYSVSGKTLFSTGIGSKQSPINNDYDLQQSSWYRGFLAASSSNSWLAINFIYEDEPQLISFLPIATERGMKLTEILAVSVSQRELQETIGDGLTGTLLVTDAAGTPVITVSPSGDSPGAENKLLSSSGQEDFVYQQQSEWSGLRYTYRMPPEERISVSSISSIYSAIIFAFMLLILSLAVVGVSRYIVLPVSQLFKAMNRVKKGDFSARLPETRLDELGMINKNFNEMADDLEKLVEENYYMSLFKKDLELKFVITQINEHFLYNTLDAIHWSARKHHNSEISAVVSKLSCFYRNILSGGQDLVAIEQIEQILDAYLYVQKFRMQERLTYRIEIEPAIKNFKILKYLFQPIVENAVLHGVAKRPEGGHIFIKLEARENKIHFSVFDNGVGIPHDKLTELLTEIYDNDAKSTSFALKNVNTQLKLYYGETYYLQMESTEGVGTTVWFDVPMSGEE